MENQSLSPQKAIRVIYTNWKGQTQERSIIPIEFVWGSTEWHPHEQWLIKCWDMDRQDYRLYAFKDIEKILSNTQK